VSGPGLIKACLRCGKTRATNHSRTTPHCSDCHTAPQHPTDAWMEHGACNNPANDPDWWWPETVHDSCIPVAVAICFGCPVRDLCLDYAIRNDEREGIWGAMTSAQRNQLKAERRRVS
jgi:hypothetical protein